jgi:hypothetical protein
MFLDKLFSGGPLYRLRSHTESSHTQSDWALISREGGGGGAGGAGGGGVQR